MDQRSPGCRGSRYNDHASESVQPLSTYRSTESTESIPTKLRASSPVETNERILTLCHTREPEQPRPW